MIKKLIYILILFIICANIQGNSVFAQTQNAYLEYNGYKYSFKPGDEIKFLKNANTSMLLFEKSLVTVEKAFYLQEAMRYYFLLSQINPKSIDAQVGLGRVYDVMKLDKYAKEHFFMALNMDNTNPQTNFYFANFYYDRSDFITAISYFKQAYEHGYSKNYELNYKMGVIYEKLADIESAKKFYTYALRLNPINADLGNKIRLLDELNYSHSQYYLYRK